MAKKSALNRLDAAREAHATTTTQITELETQRNAALLADNDDLAVKLFGKLETLRAVARGHVDKVALLSAEAERERREAILRGHQALVGRFTKTLESSDADLSEAADLIAQAWKKVCSGIEKREKARAAFSVRSSHARAGAESIEGAAMSGHAVTALLAYEFYRISARPLFGGVPGAKAPPSLPGALCPRLDLQLTPERITPFAEKLRAASAFAVKTLRDELAAGAGDVAEQAEEQPQAPITSPLAPAENGAEKPQRTGAAAELERLLKQQAEKALDVSPEGEAAYQAIVSEIARVSQLVEAEKIGAAHG